MFSPLLIYKEQISLLQEENTIYQHNIHQLAKYLSMDPSLQLEIDSLQERIAQNIKYLRMLRVNILAIKRATNQLQIDKAEMIESINIIQDKIQQQLANPYVAKYFVRDYQNLEFAKTKLRVEKI